MILKLFVCLYRSDTGSRPAAPPLFLGALGAWHAWHAWASQFLHGLKNNVNLTRVNSTAVSLRLLRLFT